MTDLKPPAVPEVWWSPSRGLLRRLGDELRGPHAVLDEPPADAVRLISEDAADADALVRQARLKGMTIDEGAVELGLESPRELMIAWVWGARAMLGDAPNYSETRVDFPSASMTVKAAGEIDRYVLTVQRAGKLTPHEARQAAEAERDQLRSELAEEKREHLRTIDDALRVKEAWTAREQEIAAAAVPDTGQAREATGRRDTAVEAAVAAWRDVQRHPFVMPEEMTELAIALDELTAAHETDLAYARSEVDKWLASNDPYCILPTRTEHIPALLARLDELEGTR